MSKLIANLAHGFVGFINKSLIKNLIVITLCILFFFVQVFYPYQYYASAQRRPSSSFQVGIHYVYEQDSIDQIYSEVSRISELGFKTVRITLECNQLEENDSQNLKNDVFFSATDNYGLAVALVIKNLDTPEKVNYYLNRWGSHLSYIQVLNEPEASSTWSMGSLFTDDEITSKFEIMYNTVASHKLPVQLYTNFGIGYILRSNVPIELSKKLDFVGLDIFMDSFLVLSPHFIENLQKITGKEVIITEFGMSTSNSQTQSDYLIRGLNLFKSMGIKGCWLVYWNSELDNYGIRGTQSETAVGEWIAKNAN
ncbi:MAG: hypothetical protein NWE98_07240 [Candidatus Bathyarchaeota archaeon]|nr:hypothetical protein [Candidatus Bathyarchaeota archaeon]